MSTENPLESNSTPEKEKTLEEQPAAQVDTEALAEKFAVASESPEHEAGRAEALEIVRERLAADAKESEPSAEQRTAPDRAPRMPEPEARRYSTQDILDEIEQHKDTRRKVLGESPYIVAATTLTGIAASVMGGTASLATSMGFEGAVSAVESAIPGMTLDWAAPAVLIGGGVLAGVALSGAAWGAMKIVHGIQERRMLRKTGMTGSIKSSGLL